MGFQKQHGMIGKSDIVEAKEKLENYFSTNIYVQRKNNLVVGSEFEEIEELLGNDYLNTYLNLQEYKNEMIDQDEDYDFNEDDSDILDYFNDGTVYRVMDGGGNEYLGNDKNIVIVESITDGEVFIFTHKEAIENLESDYVNESLVIWLLK